MWRRIAAVVVGYFAIGVLVVITDLVWAAAVPGFRSMARPPGYYFAASLATDSLYSMAGGFLCAAIARAYSGKATLALVIFGEIIGLAATVFFWTTVPHWFGFCLLILYPPAVWLGSRLRTRSVRVNTASVA